jgi:hypothetical protein
MRPKATVCNIFAEGAKVAFVFESPHTDEVAHGYPLAGSAGRRMSGHIFDRRDVPFGLIALARAHGETQLLSRIGLPSLKAFSIMNVSREPLQETAYIANGLLPPKNINLKVLLRGNPKLSARHRNLGLSKLKAALYEDFRSQCAKLTDGTMLVPCGTVARAFAMRCERMHTATCCASDIPSLIPRREENGVPWTPGRGKRLGASCTEQPPESR